MVRLLSGVVLIAVTLAAILFLPIVALRVVACVVAALGAHEYCRIIGSDDRAVLPVLWICWVVSGDAWPRPELLLVPCLAWVAVNVLFGGQTVQQASSGVFAAAYIGMPLGMLVATQARLGSRATLLLIATVVVSDSLQYYSGRMFGRHPLAPAISPKKTIEGAVGGVVAGTVFMIVAGPWLFPMSTPLWRAMLGLAIVVFGIAGDLFESRLKRVAGLKDSAALIPGHGGVLDRVDALLFATPAFYVVSGLAR